MSPEPSFSSSEAALVDGVLRRLRLGATLAHGLPGARLLVHDGDELCSVARAQADLAPCALRFAIREALDTGDVAPVSARLGFDAGGPVECRLVLTDRDVTDLEGGVYAIRSDEHLGVVFATLLGPDQARTAAREALRARGHSTTPCSDRHRPLRVYQDRATATTVLMGQVAIDDPGAEAFIAGARTAAAGCVIEELIAGV